MESQTQDNKYKFFAVGAIGTFMATLDGSIVNVALPTIADELNCSVGVVAWVALAYSLTLVSLLMVYGAWTERKGFAFAYKLGFVLFMVGSLLCALSWSISILIAARVIQATGTAMFASVGPAMVTTIFPAKERGKGIGLMVMMVSAGFTVGPPLGGFLLDFWPWSSVFYINLPVGVLGLVLTVKYFGMLRPPVKIRPMPLAGSISISITMVTAMLALSLVGDYSLTDMRIWGLGIVSVAALLFFIRFESHEKHAMIGLKIFRNRQFSTAVGSILLMFSALSGTLLLLPFYLERVLGLVPRQVGFYLIVLPVVMFVMAPLAGRISDRIGYRLLPSMGMGIMAVGLYLLSELQIDSSSQYIVGSLVAVGCGIGLFSTPNASALMGSVTEQQRSITSGILATTRNIGISSGVAISTGMFAYFFAELSGIADEKVRFVASYQSVIHISIGIALICLIVCATRRNRLG